MTPRRFLPVLLLLVLAACEREDREVRPDPMGLPRAEAIVQGSLSPGSSPVARISGIGPQYEANAYHVNQGKKWFSAYNCTGCHANGGGNSGPPLMDEKWLYGGAIENIVETIREGRPNGMPSFRDKITDEQVWQLAAYIRSMSGHIAKDVAPGRNDDLNPHPPENAMETVPAVPGGKGPDTGERPQ